MNDQDFRSELIAVIIFLLLAMTLGFLFGGLWRDSVNRDQAIENNAGYWHPQTGEFTWGSFK